MMEMLPKIGVAPPESIFARIERGPWTRKNPLWPLLASQPGRRIILSLAANTQNTLQYAHKANMKTYLLHKYAANTSRPIFLDQGWMFNKFWWTWEREGKFAANPTDLTSLDARFQPRTQTFGGGRGLHSIKLLKILMSHFNQVPYGPDL